MKPNIQEWVFNGTPDKLPSQILAYEAALPDDKPPLVFTGQTFKDPYYFEVTVNYHESYTRPMKGVLLTAIVTPEGKSKLILKQNGYGEMSRMLDVSHFIEFLRKENWIGNGIVEMGVGGQSC